MRSQIRDIVYNLTMSNYANALTMSNYVNALTNSRYLQPHKVKLGPCAHKFQLFQPHKVKLGLCTHKFQMFTTSQSQDRPLRSQILGGYNLTMLLAHAFTNSSCSQSHKVKLGPCSTNIRCAQVTTSSLAPVLINLMVRIRHTVFSNLFLREI
jgi:hypothetical protein